MVFFAKIFILYHVELYTQYEKQQLKTFLFLAVKLKNVKYKLKYNYFKTKIIMMFQLKMALNLSCIKIVSHRLYTLNFL